MKRPAKHLFISMLVSGLLATGFLVLHGTVLADSKTSFQNAVNVRAASVPASTPVVLCPVDFTCLFTGTNYTGAEQQEQSFDDHITVENSLPSGWVTRSFINARAERSRLIQFMTGGGATHCMSPNSSNPNISGSPAIHDEWLLLTKNTSPC